MVYSVYNSILMYQRSVEEKNWIVICLGNTSLSEAGRRGTCSYS